MIDGRSDAKRTENIVVLTTSVRFLNTCDKNIEPVAG